MAVSEVDQLVEARRSWTSLEVRSWYDAEALDAHLRSGLTVEAERLGDAAFGAGFRDAIANGASSDALDWANRRLELASGGWAVTGIRYRGGDGLRPFVDVVATSAPPTPTGLTEVADAVLPAYQGFSPRCLRVDVSDPHVLLGEIEGDPRFGPGSGVDMYVVAGRVSELRAFPRATEYDRVQLRAADPVSMSGRVNAIYAELAAERPELTRWASPEDLDSLTDCADEGLLFEVLVEGKPAGVIASLRYDAHAMIGWSVQEICLDADHRGRHVAAAAVQRLVDVVPTVEGGAVWGTIHPDNVPSLRNALSVGRRIVGGYVWVTPAGLPGMF